MKDIKDIRSCIKPLGFNVRTINYSHGKHAVYMKGVKKLPTIFTAAELREWRPLLNWLREHSSELDSVKSFTGIYGVNPNK